MKIFYLEDHEFFASEIIEYLEDLGHNVYYVSNYKDAEDVIKNNNFDISLLDVILQNGKTGILFAEEYGEKLGRIMFITGTPDKTTLDACDKYSSASKMFCVWDQIDSFLDGGNPKIERNSNGMASGAFKALND